MKHMDTHPAQRNVADNPQVEALRRPGQGCNQAGLVGAGCKWKRSIGAMALSGWLLLLPVTGLAQESLGRDEERKAGPTAGQRREKRTRREAARNRKSHAERSEERGLLPSGDEGKGGEREDGPGALPSRTGAEARLTGMGNSGSSASRSPEVKITSDSVTHRLRLAPHGVIVVEFPLADALYAVHPGNQNIVEVDIDKDHKPNDPIVFRPGPNFDPMLKTQTIHSLQFISGLFVTLIFEPTDRIENNDHRVILQYDIARIRGIRAEKGLATNLVRRPNSPLLEEDPKQQPLPPTQPELFTPLPPAERRKTGVGNNQAQTPESRPAPELRPEAPSRKEPPAPASKPPLPPPPVPTSALPDTNRGAGPTARTGAGAAGKTEGTGNSGGEVQGAATGMTAAAPRPEEGRAETGRMTGSAPPPAYREQYLPSFTLLGLQLEAEARRQPPSQSSRPAVDGENGRILYPESGRGDGEERGRGKGKTTGQFRRDEGAASRKSQSGRASGSEDRGGMELYRLDQERPTPVIRQWQSGAGEAGGEKAIQPVQYGGQYGAQGTTSPVPAAGPTPAEREKYRLLLEYYQSLGLSIPQMHALRGDLERRLQNHVRQKSANWLSSSEIKQARQTFSRWPAMVCFVEIVDEPDFPGLRRYILSITVHEKAERPVYLASLEPDIFIITRNGKNIVNTERILPLVTLAGSTDSVIRPGETAYFGVAIPRPVLSDNQLLEIGFIDAEKANRPILAREFRIRRP